MSSSGLLDAGGNDDGRVLGVLESFKGFLECSQFRNKAWLSTSLLRKFT